MEKKIQKWIDDYYSKLLKLRTVGSAAELLTKSALSSNLVNGMAIVLTEDNKIIATSGSLSTMKNIDNVSSKKITFFDIPRGKGKVLVDGIRVPSLYNYINASIFLFSLFSDMILKIRSSELSGILDSNTGLFNRNFIIEEVDFVIKQLERYGGEFSLIHISIDFQEEYIDKNREELNKIIKNVSAFFISILRETDRIGYLKEGEFLVLLSRAGMKGAEIASARILDFYRKKNYPYSLSIGISTYPNDTTVLDELLEYAEKALQVARDIGGDTASRFK